MNATLPPLAWIRTFEAAARHASFAAAAKELGMTPAAASQHVRALETHLGFALFERLPRGVALTAMGSAWVPSVRKSLDDLSVATTGLFGANAWRLLTVRSAFSFASLCLARHLPAFLGAHPGLSLRLLTAVWSDAAEAGHIDVDIRYGGGGWDGADALRLTEPVSVPVCPPGARFGPDAAADLRKLATGGVVHIMGCENLWTALACDLGWPDAVVAGGASVDSSLIALEMVAAGHGCAMIETALAQGHLDAGRVVAPPGLALRHDQSHHLLLPRRARPPSSAALMFRAWLAQTYPCSV